MEASVISLYHHALSSTTQICVEILHPVHYLIVHRLVSILSWILKIHLNYQTDPTFNFLESKGGCCDILHITHRIPTDLYKYVVNNVYKTYLKAWKRFLYYTIFVCLV